jgi:hypothetical protein
MRRSNGVCGAGDPALLQGSEKQPQIIHFVQDDSFFVGEDVLGWINGELADDRVGGPTTSGKILPQGGRENSPG